MIEAHLCFDKTQFGPDTASSLTPKQFHRLSEARDAIHTMLSVPLINAQWPQAKQRCGTCLENLSFWQSQ